MGEKKVTISLGFLQTLLLVFITLKLTGQLDWSWWWVLAPLWGEFALAIFLIIVLVMIKALKPKRSIITPKKPGDRLQF